MNRKVLLLAACIFLGYRISKFPDKIETHQFFNILNYDSSSINSLSINFDSIFYKRNGIDYITNYPNTNSFYLIDTLIEKNIPFDYLTGINAVLKDPYMESFAFSGLLGILLVDCMNSYLPKFKKSVEKLELSDKEEILKGYIVNEDVKKEIEIIMDQLRNPEKYKEKNIRLCKGILLYGKTGTGKTLLAKVIY